MPAAQFAARNTVPVSGALAAGTGNKTWQNAPLTTAPAWNAPRPAPALAAPLPQLRSGTPDSALRFEAQRERHPGDWDAGGRRSGERRLNFAPQNAAPALQRGERDDGVRLQALPPPVQRPQAAPPALVMSAPLEVRRWPEHRRDEGRERHFETAPRQPGVEVAARLQAAPSPQVQPSQIPRLQALPAAPPQVPPRALAMPAPVEGVHHRGDESRIEARKPGAERER
ncbi:hypothetical protein AAKU55_000551 [Oxalobacteraceae bacterium GrIS 1.11]